MRGWWIGAGIAAMLLAGCARTPDPAPIAIEADSITFETGPCFGACPVYAVTVRPDGSGTFEGKRFTQVAGTRSFQATPEQYRALLALLAPYRPASGQRRYAPGEPGCTRAATDMPSAEVTWTRAIGDSQQLYFYFGCDMEENRALAQALSEVPDKLPIAAFIDRR